MGFNEHLLNRLEAIQASLMAQHRGGLGLPSAVVGNERETFLRGFLQQVFPSHRRFATGVITDSRGQLSGQVDIAVEYGFVPSFPMPNSEERLLLAESVAMVIEVKSNLSAQWTQVRETARKVKVLHRDLNVRMSAGPPPGPTIPFLAVGYTGFATREGLHERLAATPEDERPDLALVIDSGAASAPAYGLSGLGGPGLYAFCLVVNRELERVTIASPNLLAYATGARD